MAPILSTLLVVVGLVEGWSVVVKKIEKSEEEGELVVTLFSRVGPTAAHH